MLKLEHLNKEFLFGNNKVMALKDINLDIQRGEFIAIIGQSGSGKSTLMNIIGCLDTQTSGKYIIEGKDVSSFNSNEKARLREEKFGFVFQRYNLITSLNSLQNVVLPAIYSGMQKNEREKRAIEILDSLDMKDKALSMPNKLSGGQQQRVSIARALMNGGEIILADEPTGALDSKSGEMVMEIITSLHKQGHTIILVTHDKNIANYANRIIEIKDGRILTDEVKKDEKYTLSKQSKLKKSYFSNYFNKFIQSFKMSINAIFSHKLRSLLTMLGIIIGILSVISVVALGEGSKEKILSSIRAIGTNTINIYPGKSFGDMQANRVNTLSTHDSFILNKQPYLEYSTPNTATSGTATYGNKNLSAALRGGSENSLHINGIKIESGRNFTKYDIDSSNAVVIIDDMTKEEFFKDVEPIGKIIFFNKKPLKVIGVTQKDDGSFGGASNLRLYAPFSTVINKITGDRSVQSITVKVKDNISPQLAETGIIELLTQKHGTKDFFTRNSDTIRQTVESTIGTMKILISSIAFISLFVGGIGVMNIMLVSVTERTKEIGIKMAIGAKQSDILKQFLIESIILCIIGGVLGLTFAYTLGFIFNALSTDFNMIFDITPAVIAILTSTFIGIVFGYIPARNASKLNPIDALLQE